MEKNINHKIILGVLLVVSAFWQVNFAQTNKESELFVEAKLVTDNEGWIRSKSRIFWTKDAGISWSDITPQPSTSAICSVFFLNSQKGWVLRTAAQKNKLFNSFLEIAQTDDGGKTWKESSIQNSGDDLAALFGGEASLDFINETQGWMILRQASSSNFSRGRLFVTADGGESWSELPAPPIFSQLEFINSNDGWLAGGASGKEIYVTRNGGKEWSPFKVKAGGENDSPTAYGLPKFQDEKAGILPVSYSGKDKVIIKFFETKNSGYEWKLKTSVTLAGNPDDFTKPVFSLTRSESIVTASMLDNLLYFSENDLTSNLSLNLLSNETISAIEFRDKNTGWILTSYGACEGFKTACSQKTRLLRVNSEGNLKDISPTAVGKSSEFTEPDPLTDLVFTSNNKGFDKCAAATVSQMQTWWNSSPYYDANIYIGGVSRSCAQANLNASWVTQIFAQGWKLIPTWVGPQAPCSAYSNKISSNTTTARSQGISEANSAANTASQLGLNPQTIIYYDLEHYNTDASCSAAVKAFLGGWTQRLHELGNIAGVYGSPINAAGDWVAASPVPDAVWLAKWDDRVTVWGLNPLSDTLWSNNQRLHQYHGGHDETYGGITFNIDNDISGGPVAGSGSSPCNYSISPTSQNFASSGGTGTINVTTSAGCGWAATSNASWITVTSGTPGSGNGTVGYSVAANTGTARTGTVTAAGQTFTVNQNAAAACPSPSSIVTGQTINGTLQSGDCTYTDSSYYDAYTFNGTAGQQIYITLNSTQFNAYLLFYQSSYPGGTLIAQDNDGGGGTNARIPATSGFFTLPGTGTYTILANSLAAGETGSYSLFLGAASGGTVQFGSAAYSVNENAGSATITVTRTGGTSAFGVNYATSNGSATAGADYTVSSGTLSFAANETSKTFTVPIIDDVSFEGSETVNLMLSNPTGGVTLGSPNTAVLTIADNDTACTYTMSTNSNNVGPGTGSTNFFMTAPSGCTWTAVSNSPSWLTTSSSGSGNGTINYNYTANTSTSPRTGTITAGGQVHTVTQIGVGGGGSVLFNSATYSVNENAGTATITVTRTGGTASGSVQYSISNGTATAGVDYQSAGGTLFFFENEMSKTFTVTILNDSAVEGNETINLSLSGPSSSFLLGSPSTATLTITDDDSPPANRKPADFDGDGKTDISIFRPSNGQWWINQSSSGGVAAAFGVGTDRIVPADYTGDGKTDIAFWRPATGEWFILRSDNSSFYSVPFGTSGDIPAPGDFDGDGKADTAVYRPSNGTWYISKSSGSVIIQQFGAAEDKPVVADYDGDGKSDIAIFRPSNSQWWLLRSSQGIIAAQFGVSGDKPVPGNFTGDGKADIAAYRPSTGFWFILRSEDSSFYSVPFGTSGDVPTPGDYDGDGKFDTAVFRPSNATWFINRTTGGTDIVPFGASGDLPVPNAFVP
jgi:hypothetical protein